MNLDNPILFFICSVGVFNGFIVSFYFLLFSKHKRIQNTLFGLLLLLLSVRIGKSVFKIFTEPSDIDFLISQVGLSACFLIGVSLYYYLKSSIENAKSIPKSWKIHFLGLFIIITIFGLFVPFLTHQNLWLYYVIDIIFIVWGIYIVCSAYLLKEFFRKWITKQEKLTISEAWLLWVFIGNVLIYVSYLAGYVYLYLVSTITFSVVFYGLLLFLLFKNNRENIFKDIPKKYNTIKIEDEEARELKELLHSTMLDKQFYTKKHIKLKDIANELDISSHKLSQFLNDNLNKSFTSFINDYRIEKAKLLLRENKNYTLEAIGFEAGFTSRSTFYSTFKKVVEQTPAEYKRQFD